MAYSPLGNGFLSGRFNAQTQYVKGDFRRTMKRFSADVMTKNQPVLDLLHELAAAKSATAAHIVLAAENLGALRIRLTADELHTINQKLGKMDIDESYF